MADAYIIDAARTPRGIGKAGRGALAGFHSGRLLAKVFEAIGERNQLNTADIDDVINEARINIVVSMYKLLDDTELSVNMGLLAFILWLISSTMASAALDPDYIWQELEDEFVN